MRQFKITMASERLLLMSHLTKQLKTPKLSYLQQTGSEDDHNANDLVDAVGKCVKMSLTLMKTVRRDGEAQNKLALNV